MKKIPLFEQCVANVAPEVMEEVNLNIDIANRIYDLLKAKNLTQHEFASRMGKRDSEISRWLTGTHGFTTATLAKISFPYLYLIGDGHPDSPSLSILPALPFPNEESRHREQL